MKTGDWGRFTGKATDVHTLRPNNEKMLHYEIPNMVKIRMWLRLLVKKAKYFK